MAHDASATWSGFNYQGKVGLFYALKLINNGIVININTNFDLHEIIFENHEDFDIKVNGLVESIHQVKAYNSVYLSKYINAIITTVIELHAKRLVNTLGYLHTWKEITFQNGQTAGSYALTEITAIKSEWDDATTQADSKIQKTVNTALSASQIPKLSAILRQSYPNFTGAQIAQDLGLYISTAQQSTVANFTVYQYPSGRGGCDLEEINDLILDQLSSYLQLNNLPNSPDIRNRIFNLLLGLLDRHIIDRHNNLNQPIGPISIGFTELLEILDDTNVGDASPALLALEFKKVFSDCIYSFINDPDLCDDAEYIKYFSETDKSELEQCLESLLTLPASQLLEYYIQQSPQVKINLQERVISNAFNIEKGGITEALLYILNLFPSRFICNDLERSRLTYLSEGHHFLPTTINSGTPSTLAKKILQNLSFIENTFEISTLLGGRQCPEIKDFIESFDRCRDVNIDEYLNELSPPRKDRITEINKNLKLKPIQNVIGEIND
jgi:hypothetical protein